MYMERSAPGCGRIVDRLSHTTVTSGRKCCANITPWTPLQCHELGGFLGWLVTVAMTPLVAMLLAPLAGMLLALRARARNELWVPKSPQQGGKMPSAEVLTESLYRTLFVEQLLSFLTFPVVSSTAFSAFEW